MAGSDTLSVGSWAGQLMSPLQIISVGPGSVMI